MSNEFDPNPYDNVSVDEALTQIYERCNDRTIRQMVTVLKNAIDTGGGGLPADTKIGSALSMSIDPLTFVVTAVLKDQDGENLGSMQTIDVSQIATNASNISTLQTQMGDVNMALTNINTTLGGVI